MPKTRLFPSAQVRLPHIRLKPMPPSILPPSILCCPRPDSSPTPCSAVGASACSPRPHRSATAYLQQPHIFPIRRCSHRADLAGPRPMNRRGEKHKSALPRSSHRCVAAATPPRASLADLLQRPAVFVAEAVLAGGGAVPARPFKLERGSRWCARKAQASPWARR